MFAPKRPEVVAARKELIQNLTYFVVAIAAIRASTYVLSALQRSS
jgi:hypothetical protein